VPEKRIGRLDFVVLRRLLLFYHPAGESRVSAYSFPSGIARPLYGRSTGSLASTCFNASIMKDAFRQSRPSSLIDDVPESAELVFRNALRVG